MNTKIATVFLVFCAVHGLQAQHWPRPSLFRPRPNIFSGSLSSNRLPNCFLNALNAIAQAQLGMNQAAQNAINQGTPEDIARQCVKEQQANLQAFADRLSGRVTEIMKGVDQEEALAEISHELKEELQHLSDTISSTPGKVAELLNNGSMQEAVGTFQAARDKVTVHVETLWAIVKEHSGENSELYNQATKLGNEILLMGYNGAQGLIGSVNQCINDRTPKSA